MSVFQIEWTQQKYDNVNATVIIVNDSQMNNEFVACIEVFRWSRLVVLLLRTHAISGNSSVNCFLRRRGKVYAQNEELESWEIKLLSMYLIDTYFNWHVFYAIVKRSQCVKWMVVATCTRNHLPNIRHVVFLQKESVQIEIEVERAPFENNEKRKCITLLTLNIHNTIHWR